MKNGGGFPSIGVGYIFPPLFFLRIICFDKGLGYLYNESIEKQQALILFTAFIIQRKQREKTWKEKWLLCWTLAGNIIS